jgi:transaldolase/glucose-6-phosphate isomerase
MILYFIVGATLLLPTQTIYPGALESAYKRELQSLVTDRAVTRLWGKDPTLWPSEAWQGNAISSNLGWLDLPSKMAPYMSHVLKRSMDIETEGFQDIVFVGMGGSNLAADAILHLPSAQLGKQRFLLDSTDPASIAELEKKLDLQRTLFVFASKSGKGIETHALLLYFMDQLKASGISSPGRHFVALTEKNSYLASLAGEYRFSDVFFDPPGISGKYSSLIHFGLFLSVVCQINPGELSARMSSMAEACGPSTPAPMNPALTLGAFLAAGEIEGRDRLIFLSTPSVERFGYCVGNLVGTSTGKEDHGIVPIFGQLTYPAKMFDSACMVVALSLKGEDRVGIDARLEELQETNTPTILIELAGLEDLGVELFKWEIATTLACALVGVNPFNDPDTQESKITTAQILEQITTHHEEPPPTVRVAESGLEVFAEGELRHDVSTLNMQEFLRTFLSLRHPKGYLALLPFLQLNPVMIETLRHIRDKLVSALEIPVLITSGPRYLHAIAQVYKGGPAKGLFLIITADPLEDIAVPGAGYTFGQLQMALALGDFQSLVSHHRPTMRLHLACGAKEGMLQFDSVLTSALANIRAKTN